MDIDYKVVENTRSSLKHLSIDLSDVDILGTTVCGLFLTPGFFRKIDFKVKKFWRSQNACKNCKRAAKH